MNCLAISLCAACVQQGGDAAIQPRRTAAARRPGVALRDAPRNASAPAGAHLTYYGGRVVSNIQVVQVLWGTGSYLSQVTSTGTPSMASFYQDVPNSAYFDWLTEYNTPATGGTNQTIGHGSFASQVTITPSTTSSTVDDSVIQSEIGAQITAGHLPAPSHDGAGNTNTYYAIFFPHGITITQGGTSSCVSGGFCAYHGTIANAQGHGEVYYGVHPDMQVGSGCDNGCGAAATAFGNYTSVASHELVETVTDAEVGIATTNAAPLAWYDSVNGEIGDICNAQQGTITANGTTYVVQKEFSNAANDCIVTRAASNNFSISASPSSLTLVAGNSGSSTVSTAVVSGSAESIALTVSGAPSGVTATPAPATVTAGNSSTLSIATTTATVPGTYTLTITGAAPSATHTTTVSLTVTAPPPPPNDFSISANPGSVSIPAGGSGTSTISTALLSGVAETIALTASGAPSGVTATLSPTSVSTGMSSTLTIAATSAATPGLYPLTVTGTAPSATHATTVSLTITGTPPAGVVNGGFEQGFDGWLTTGTTSIVTTGCHTGSCAMAGAPTATNGDSTISQTFTSPNSWKLLSVWFEEKCPALHDWASITLTDNTNGFVQHLLPPRNRNTGWRLARGLLAPGHSYTLKLLSHDDNAPTDPCFTLFDDVAIVSPSFDDARASVGVAEAAARGD